MRQFKRRVICASFLFSLLLDVGGAFADIQMTAQLMDPQRANGKINARILQAYNNVDVYVGMITASGDLYCLKGDGSRWEWEAGVHPMLQGVSLAATDWLTLEPIDLSQIMGDPLNSHFLVVLVTQGADPLKTENWVYAKEADFVTYPFDRKPGQTLFASTSTSDFLLSPLAPVDTVNSGAAPAAGDQASAQPEKADIFKISGQRLLYANASGMRFQMIDLSDPANPALLASVPIQETPRELFLVGEYAYLIGSSYTSEGTSTVLRVYRTGETIQEIQHLGLDQLSYVTSRKLGNRIYLVGMTPSASEPCCQWPGTGQAAVYAVDITSPGATAVIAHVTAASNVFDVYMDSRYLVVLGWDTWPSTALEIFDLSSEVPLSRKATLSIPGLVPSEHHVHTSGSLLYAVYQHQTLAEGSTLAVYDVADLANIKALGRVGRIAPGEALFATRFTDKRAYVVTYERKDPLWVVDLSFPSLPRIAGELQVPGWSEYMEFFDDRLLAIGYDDSQGKRLVSVALFSVSDPSSPQLLDRVTPLAEKASYSYSEATSDDRAFAFNQETGMLLFPLHYYDNGTGTNISGLEILKLKTTAEGFSWQSHVRSRFYVLRGAETDQSDMVLSVGDSALSTIDVSDPLQALVLGELRLAYDVTQVAGRDSSYQLWTLGTDYYGFGESELILFEGDNLDRPARAEDTGLGWAQILTDNQIGVLFEPQTPRFKAVDLQTVTLGTAVAIEGATPWSVQSPLLQGHTFYAAYATGTVLPWPPEPVFTSGSSSGEGSGGDAFPLDEVSNPVQWRLFRYDCSDIHAPSALPVLSIPGRPIGFTAGGKLVTVEETSPYYQASTLIPSGIADPDRGILLNVLTIRQDQAILEATRFFSYTEFGYATALTDQRAVYVSFSKDQSTMVMTLSPHDLTVTRSDTMEGLLAPIKAFNGKLLFRTYGSILPLSGGPVSTDALYAPIPSYSPEVAVYDLTVSPAEKILSLEGVYVDAWGAALDETGLYMAKGYAGVSFVPF